MGDQPFPNEDGTVLAAPNGETYNRVGLRVELLAQGHRVPSTCDTEVLAHLYEEDGIDCVLRCRGMFVFAVWGRKRVTLNLVQQPAHPPSGRQPALALATAGSGRHARSLGSRAEEGDEPRVAGLVVALGLDPALRLSARQPAGCCWGRCRYPSSLLM